MPDELVRVLTEIQRRGAIGRGSIEDAIAHAGSFVDALPEGASSLIDLGSGGGLPGLVLAARCPGLRVTLVERRAKRVDLLRYGVRALRLDAHVDVIEGDAHELSILGPVDVVTARSFGPLHEVLRAASALLPTGGVCIVSTPPQGASTDFSAGAGIVDAGVAAFTDGGQVGSVRRWVRC